MKHALLLPLTAVVLPLCTAFGSPQESSQRPGPALERELDSREATRTFALEGRVLMPDGSPASGAVVVAEAGGRSATDASGAFRLDLELPLDVRAVRVTALKPGGANGHSAGALVQLPVAGGRAFAGSLRLESSGSCVPDWLATFGPLPGTNDSIAALAVIDDGGGAALYAGGSFSSAGGVIASYIAKWDGSSWSALGSGLDEPVLALAVFDDGGGPALYAGGLFTSAGGVAASHVAKWDGSSWSPLGSGLSGAAGTTGVHALHVFDDGGATALYVGGRFTQAGGATARYVARWDGASWSPLGLGVDNTVFALTTFNDGSGGGRELHAGGLFALAGGAPANRVAKWTGATWVPLGSGVDDQVRALAVHDAGAGLELYAGGSFSTAGGLAASCVASWNGATWSALGAGVDDGGIETIVYALASHDDGSGQALYVGGAFGQAGGQPASQVARWDGTSWAPVGSGFGSSSDEGVLAFAAFDDGGGTRLHAAGEFREGDGAPLSHLAQWDGASWSRLGEIGLSGSVRALTVFDDGSGSGPELHAAGTFKFAQGLAASRIAKWDGFGWSALAEGLDDTVLALAAYDDGLGNRPALYAGGDFYTIAGGGGTGFIARWNGTSWSTPGGGAGSTVRALLTFDDGLGGGPALYAGGDFSGAGGTSANHIAKWDGADWSNLGGGVAFQVYALAAFDDGTGSVLIAGGHTTATGPLAKIAKWDGTAWSALGTGVGGRVRALAVFDDGLGGGPALYAGGEFATAGGIPALRIARWDGTAWSALGSGIDDTIHALAVFDDGQGAGPALYAAGVFTLAGGVPADRIARWDGTAWSGIAGGFDLTIHALATGDDGSGSGPALFAGGTFTHSSAGDCYVAKWGCAPMEVGAAYCFGDGSGTPCPCGNSAGPGEGCGNSSGLGGLLGAIGSSSVAADDLVFHAAQLLHDQPALLFVAENAVNGGDGLAFGDGLRCAGGGVRRFDVRVPDARGATHWGPGLGSGGGWSAGDTRRFQVWYRNPTGSPCATNFNLTNGHEVAFGS